jgi:hypothetical protein
LGIRWAKSNTIERDNNDNRATGAKAYFFVGGTTTPLTVYQDADEATAHTHPVVADGNGRWPVVFIPFAASYDEQVVTASGTELWYDEDIPNPDPVEAAAESVGDDELISTGFVIWSDVDETRSGYVRCNGRTIGNAASGGTERANADTEALFTYRWNKLADGQAAVSGGRGASAAADYAANKTIALPDLRGAMVIGLGDMGATDASATLFPAAVTFTHGNGATPGSLLGANSTTLTQAQLPNVSLVSSSLSWSGTSAFTQTGTGTFSQSGTGTFTQSGSGTATGNQGSIFHTGGTSDDFSLGSGRNTYRADTISLVTPTATVTGITGTVSGVAGTVSGVAGTVSVSGSISGTVPLGGSGTAQTNVSRAITGTFYMKL